MPVVVKQFSNGHLAEASDTNFYIFASSIFAFGNYGHSIDNIEWFFKLIIHVLIRITKVKNLKKKKLGIQKCT